MTTVTVSPKFQVVIPKEVRVEHRIHPGMKLAMVSWKGTIRLVPVRPMKDLRGAFPALDTTIDRMPDRAV